MHEAYGLPQICDKKHLLPIPKKQKKIFSCSSQAQWTSKKQSFFFLVFGMRPNTAQEQLTISFIFDILNGRKSTISQSLVLGT